jgi:hypothetical protein
MAEQLAISIQQSPRSGSDYPFIDGGDQLKLVLLDVAVQHDPAAALPLSVVTANNLHLAAGSGNQIRLVIKDRNNATVFDTLQTTYVSSHSWGTFYTTHTWVDVLGNLLRVTIGSANQTGFPPSLSGLAAVLDPRTYVPVLPGVQRMLIHSHGVSPVAISPNYVVHFRQGYNTTYEVAATPRRTRTGERLPSITTLSAAPRQGLGQYPGCGDQNNPYVRSLNQQPPSVAGSFLLSGDSCFRVEPNVVFDEAGNATLIHGSLKLYDDCEACCDCEDYLRPYYAIQRAKRLAEPLAEQIAALRQRYIDAKSRLESALNCLLGSLLRLDVTVNQECQLMITAGMFNGTAQPIYNKQFEFWVMEEVEPGVWTQADLAHVPDTGILLEQHRVTSVVYVTRQPDNSIRTALNCIPPNETHLVSFRVGLFGNKRIRVCFGFVGADPEDFICREISTLCTYVPYTS